jgi:hypothetical protein
MDYYKADPSPEMLESSQFQAIWQIIKNWDIGFIEGPPYGRMGANGNHVAMILHALATPPESKQFQHQADNWRKEIRECDAKVDEAYRQGALEALDEAIELFKEDIPHMTQNVRVILEQFRAKWEAK